MEAWLSGDRDGFKGKNPPQAVSDLHEGGAGMKKIIICGAAALLLLGNEILGWLGLLVLAGAFLCWLLKEAAEGGFFE